MSPRLAFCLMAMVLACQEPVFSHPDHHHHGKEVPAPTYHILDDNNKSCLIMTARISFNLTDNITIYDGDFDNATASGDCTDDHSHTISLSVELDNFTARLDMSFSEANTTKKWRADMVSLSIQPLTAEIAENKAIDFAANVSFGAAQNGRYDCGDLHVGISGGNTATGGSLVFSDFRVQPFGVENNKFSPSQAASCDPKPMPHTDNTVPIAVGAALCGLVVCVLVAYLVGRSRSSRRGYQAV